ncbi:MAG: DNA repair exonuclease [Desulfobacteraceae bacterium]|nr:DNA repair exonuclease [Desulfobacteraceae bacterium]
MFKFLHAADIHLDSPLHKLDYYEGAPVDELRQATRRAFENLVELAISEAVAFVLIAGDLYDGDWKDYNTGLYFISQMSKLREANIPVYIIAGNHDAASKITKTLRLPEGVTLFSVEGAETFTLDTIGVAIHGQSFKSPAVRKNLVARYPQQLSGYFNVGILHTCATGREGHEPYAPCTIQDLQSKGYDYWALGHVHQHEVVLEDPLSVFPGNIQGRHIKETGPKGCMLVSIDDRGDPSAAFRSVDVMRWVKVELDASGVESGYEVVDLIDQKLQELLEQNEGIPLIARVEVAGDCPAHDELASNLDRWTNEIRSAAVDSSSGQVWIEKVKLRTSLPLENESTIFAEGPVGELLRYIDEIPKDPDHVSVLTESLKDLIKKLPKELKENTDAVSLEYTGSLAEVLGQIRQMLLHRLMQRGDSV